MIIYASRTGNIKHIINKLGLPSTDIKNVESINDKFIIFTYTDGLGKVPLIVEEFLSTNHEHLIGVIASGNTNFGESLFCRSANIISEKYNVPIISKLDLRGNQLDYDIIITEYNKLFGGN